jgi:hypothetical protein
VMLALVLISVQEWVIIATFALNVYVVAVSPLLRKPVVVAAKTTAHATAHATAKAGKTVAHPIKTVRKVVKEIE